MVNTYKPSGSFGPLTILYALLATAWMCAGMYVYQLLLYFIPFIYINFLLTIGAGFVGAFAINKAVQAGKCRNPMLAAGLGLLAAVVAIGAKHYFQYDALINETAEMWVEEWQEENGGAAVPEEAKKEISKELRQELSFIKHFGPRSEQGWSIGNNADGGLEVTGVMVYLVWLIEAGIILFFAVAGPYEAAGKPFNEDLQLWADEEESVGLFATDGDAFVNQITSAQTIDDLVKFPAAEPAATNSFVSYKTHSIAGEDQEDAYLTVSRMELSVNKKGETESKESPLWKFAVLPAEKRKILLEEFQRIAHERELQDNEQSGDDPEVSHGAPSDA